MKAIQKATSSELSSITDNYNELFDEILHAARSGQVINQLSAEWYQFIRAPKNLTLNREHDGLVAANLK